MKETHTGSNPVLTTNLKLKIMDTKILKKLNNQIDTLAVKAQAKIDAKKIEDQKISDNIFKRYAEQQEIIRGTRKNKINFIKSHIFLHITDKERWRLHDIIQLYYDNLYENNYDDLLNEIVSNIFNGTYIKTC